MGRRGLRSKAHRDYRVARGRARQQGLPSPSPLPIRRRSAAGASALANRDSGPSDPWISWERRAARASAPPSREYPTTQAAGASAPAPEAGPSAPGRGSHYALLVKNAEVKAKRARQEDGATTTRATLSANSNDATNRDYGRREKTIHGDDGRRHKCGGLWGGGSPSHINGASAPSHDQM